jgi:hypothetical protein
MQVLFMTTDDGLIEIYLIFQEIERGIVMKRENAVKTVKRPK